MFIGEYSHSIDEKGRLSLPAKFRRQLEGGVVVTRGLDHCLTVYPLAQWQERAQKLAELPDHLKKNRDYARLQLAGAWDADVDSQGRIMLPDYLRRYASLHKQVVVTGLYDRLEIWDTTAWQAYRDETENRSNDIAESITYPGLS